MAVRVPTPNPELAGYARRLGLDPSRIRAEGFQVESMGRTPTGRPQVRVTYRTRWGRVIVLTTTVLPPWAKQHPATGCHTR